MAEAKAENDPTLVDRWLQDQQQWQKTVLAYLDSMVKNDDFLVHLGNAMRGSLLAGKPYPTAPPPGTPPTDAAGRDKFDEVLFAVHQLEGQVQDLRMTLDEIRGALTPATPTKAPPPRQAGRDQQPRARKPTSTRTASTAPPATPAGRKKKR